MPTQDDTQQRLLQAAGRIFAEKGFEGATVREICHLARVNLAAVNYYFRDKERLYIETVKAACQVDQVPLPEWPPDMPPAAKLRDFIYIFLTRMRADQDFPWHRQLVLRELAQPTAACEAWVRDHIRPQAQILGQIVADLLPGAPDLKRRLTAFSIIGQCVFYRVATPIVKILVGEDEYRTYDARLLADHIAQFTLAALGIESPVLKQSQATPAKLV
jgi:AcrR family transcriptional regulator